VNCSRSTTPSCLCSLVEQQVEHLLQEEHRALLRQRPGAEVASSVYANATKEKADAPQDANYQSPPAHLFSIID